MSGETSSPALPATCLVCFAVENEAKPFRDRVHGMAGVKILVTGMGHENARRAISETLKLSRPELVVSSGFAGGLDLNLRWGDVVFEEPLSAETRRRLEQSGARAARFYCASRIVVTRKEKAQIRSSTGKDVVDMESMIISEVCRAEGVPVAIVRVILDEAGEDLPLDFNRVVNANQQMLFGKLFLALLRSPGKLPALIRFGNRTRKAGAALAKALGMMLSGIPPRT